VRRAIRSQPMLRFSNFPSTLWVLIGGVNDYRSWLIPAGPIGPGKQGRGSGDTIPISRECVWVVPLRASVGSTEAAKDVVARFGVVGPKRATRLSLPMVRLSPRQPSLVRCVHRSHLLQGPTRGLISTIPLLGSARQQDDYSSINTGGCCPRNQAARHRPQAARACVGEPFWGS
jgi:hypothetical protein